MRGERHDEKKNRMTTPKQNEIGKTAARERAKRYVVSARTCMHAHTHIPTRNENQMY